MALLISRLVTSLQMLNRIVCRLFCYLAAVLLAVMTVVVMFQVLMRYGVNNSMSWTEELSRTMMVWSAFLVAPWAYREGANVSIGFFQDAMPGIVRRLFELLLTLLVLWILVVFWLESIELVVRGMQSKSATLPVQTGLFYTIVPISLGAMILVGIERLCVLCGGGSAPSGDPTYANGSKEV